MQFLYVSFASYVFYMANGRILWEFYGPWLWPSMHVSLPLLPFDGLLQHIRELVHPAEGRHALFRSQATARAGCLSSMTFTEDKILCSQFML